ncbi:DUF1819 family protein [Alishewanella sp. HL-SH05]|uniref:DUF1819 family protein n=1 Tax=Alishewanella sp. HL-SH05 TaxID=3461145 RepID=UPI0040414BDB
MTYKDYLGDLIGGGLMIRESQLIAALLLTKPDQAAWDNAITNQNILQKRSDASAKRNAATIKKRLATVNDVFLEKLAYGNTELSTQLIFAATLINSTILADFMRSVVLDARRLFRSQLDASDWEHFWQQRCRLFPELATLTESSTYKIAQVAIKCVADAGYINDTRQKHLQNVYLQPEVRQLLAQLGREDIINAMEA